jgi:hypothetical protein
MRPPTCLFLIPSDDIRARTATVDWYWQGKAEEFGEKTVSVPLCPPQNPHGLTRERIRTSAVRGQRLAAWAMEWPTQSLITVFTSARHRCLRWMTQINPALKMETVCFSEACIYLRVYTASQSRSSSLSPWEPQMSQTNTVHIETSNA